MDHWSQLTNFFVYDQVCKSSPVTPNQVSDYRAHILTGRQLSEHLSTIKSESEIEWPELTEAEAIKLFSNIPINEAQMNKELAVIYCINVGIRKGAASDSQIDGDVRLALYIEYLSNHPQQKRVLEQIFYVVGDYSTVEDITKIDKYYLNCNYKGNKGECYDSKNNRIIKTPLSLQYYGLSTAILDITSALKAVSDPNITYLSTFKAEHKISWPSAEETKAIELFSDTKNSVQMNKELAIIYCIYSDFDSLPVGSLQFSSGDDRYDKAQTYLHDHPAQRGILQNIFPMKDESEKSSSEEKLTKYGDYCRELQQEFMTVDYNMQAYSLALKTGSALNTFYLALFHLR